MLKFPHNTVTDILDPSRESIRKSTTTIDQPVSGGNMRWMNLNSACYRCWCFSFWLELFEYYPHELAETSVIYDVCIDSNGAITVIDWLPLIAYSFFDKTQ